MGNDGTILRTEDEGKKPGKRATTPPDVNTALRAVIFTGATTGVAVGHGGTILRTEDGGKHWVEVTTPSGIRVDLWAVVFADAQTGGSGRPRLARSCGRRMRKKLEASGMTPSGIKTTLRAVIFTGATTGVTVGDDQTILWTEDGERAGSRGLHRPSQHSPASGSTSGL